MKVALGGRYKNLAKLAKPGPAPKSAARSAGPRTTRYAQIKKRGLKHY